MAVAARSRRTAKKDRLFFAALSECGNVTDACAAAGIPRSTAYDRRREEADFAALWSRAEELGVEKLEEEARQRALGKDVPVFYDGAQIGTRKEHSDTLLIFLLKGAKPTKYRDNAAWQQLGADGKPVDPAGPVNIVLMTYASQAPATIEGTAEPVAIDAPVSD